MNLWVIRAGSNGEQELDCLANNIVTIGWNELPDVQTFKTRQDLKDQYVKVYTEKSAVGLGLKVSQIWKFATQIKKGDLVVLPSKFAPEIHVGIIKGEYQYKKINEDIFHIVPVKWEKTISRSEFDEDLLYSFGSLLTVSQITRNNAAERVAALLKGEKKIKIERDSEEYETDLIGLVNTDDLVYTKIEQFILNNFKEHKLEELTREILRAQGFNTSHVKEIGNINNKKTKGSDGGVDILASKGSLGFEKPNICVQVKSGQTKLPASILRELGGVMAAFKAEFGLLVSWGGFTDQLIKEAREKYFTIRLWDSDNIIHEIFEHYERFSPDFKNKLPLKRIWVLEDKETKSRI